MERLELKIPPPLAFLITALLMWLCRLFFNEFNFTFRYRAIAAAACLFGAALIGLGALIMFFRAKTSVNPVQVEQTSALVTAGVYRFSRNPMYLSLACALFGWGFLLSNAVALTLPAPFILFVNRFQIRPEETALEKRFGSAFAAYKKRVRRWL